MLLWQDYSDWLWNLALGHLEEADESGTRNRRRSISRVSRRRLRRKFPLQEEEEEEEEEASLCRSLTRLQLPV